MSQSVSHPAAVAVTLSGAAAEVVPVAAAAWHSWSDEDRWELLRQLASAAADRTGAPTRAVVQWHTPRRLARGVVAAEMRSLTVTAQPYGGA